jgi:hypothetical protein
MILAVSTMEVYGKSYNTSGCSGTIWYAVAESTEREKNLVITDSVDPAPRRSWSPKRASFLANCQHNICR